MTKKKITHWIYRSKILVVFFWIGICSSISAQTSDVSIDPDYQIMYCSANNGEASTMQEIKLIIKGPENKKWFVSYSVNNSPAIVANGDKGIDISKFDLSLLLQNKTNSIQNYTIELKEAWLEDLSPLTISKDHQIATVQVLPLANPEIEDYYPKAKINSTQEYQAEIGKNSSYSVWLPIGASSIHEESEIDANRKVVRIKIQWPDKEENQLFKLIETDAFGCNSDTIFAGVELVKSFAIDLADTIYICKDEDVILNPQMDLPANYSYLWNTGETSKSITVSKPENYTLTVTDLEDNQKVNTSIKVLEQQAPIIDIPDYLILSEKNQNIDIFSNDCTYLWSDGSTTSSITLDQSGTYSVTKTSSAGCQTSKSFKAKLEEDLFDLQLPEIIHLCGDEKLTLSPAIYKQQDYQYEWSNGSHEPTITIGEAGSYWVKVTDSDGFSKTANTTVISHHNPIVDLGSDFILWDGESKLLDAGNNGASYIWNNGETSQTILANSGGVFMVEVSDQYGCSNKDTVIIDYRKGEKFGVFLGEDHHICTGDSILITPQIEGNPEYPLNYHWVNLNKKTSDIYIKNNGEYCLEVTDAYGNLESDCVTISLYPTPIVDLGKDLVSYPKKGIVLDAGTPNCFYTWSTDEITQKISVNTEGKYWVLVTNESDCSARDTIDIGFVKNYPFVGLPKAFSPNGDGVNDKLFIRGNGIDKATLIIYNRLGQKIFETTNINQGWDGFFNGVLQNIDVYIYVLEVTYLNGKHVLKKGNVALLR